MTAWIFLFCLGAVLCFCGTAHAKGGTTITRVPNKDPLSPEFLEWMEKVKGPAEEWLKELGEMEKLDHDKILADATDFAQQMRDSVTNLTNYIPQLMAANDKFLMQQDNVLDDWWGTRDKQNALWGNRDVALDEMHNLVKTGQLPAELAANMYKSINSNLNQSMGSQLSEWAKRGVVNSSTSQAGLRSLDRSASDAMAKQWGAMYDLSKNAYGSLIGAYNQSSDAYTNALNSGTGMMNALSNAAQTQGSMVGGMGSTISALTGAGNAAWEQAFFPQKYREMLWQPAAEIWKTWYNEENEPDYDTVVSQGGK